MFLVKCSQGHYDLAHISIFIMSSFSKSWIWFILNYSGEFVHLLVFCRKKKIKRFQRIQQDRKVIHLEVFAFDLGPFIWKDILDAFSCWLHNGVSFLYFWVSGKLFLVFCSSRSPQIFPGFCPPFCQQNSKPFLWVKYLKWQHSF